MKKTRKLFEPALLLGGFITSYAIFSAYRNRKNPPKPRDLEKLVNWEIKFKENTSDKDISQTLFLIDKYILDYLYKQDYYAATTFSINIVHSIVPGSLDRFILEVWVSASDKFRSGGSPAVIPPRPRPKIPAPDAFRFSSVEKIVER